MTTKNHALVEALMNAIIAKYGVAEKCDELAVIGVADDITKTATVRVAGEDASAEYYERTTVAMANNEETEETKVTCNIDTAVLIPDAVRCWWPARECTHFTINPKTRFVSSIVFPSLPIKEWNEKTECQKNNAGKPGQAVIDEETILTEFWKHNAKTNQNKAIYRHLVQDHIYDMYVRDPGYIDVSGRYQDKYVLLKTGETISGADMRGKGDARWGSGLLAELDDMFYIRLAKRYHALTGVKADQAWIDALKAKIVEDYPEDLAANTIKYISLSKKLAQLVAEEDYDAEVWPWPIEVADKYYNEMILEFYNQL